MVPISTESRSVDGGESKTIYVGTAATYPPTGIPPLSDGSLMAATHNGHDPGFRGNLVDTLKSHARRNLQKSGR